MAFLWPEFLWFLALLPALVFAHLGMLRRRRKAAIGYSSLALIKQAMASSWRRHVPALLILAAAACLAFAAARPTASVILPTQQRIVLLVMDVSGSMRAEDVAPNRISASQAAAKVFATQLPAAVRIGVVAYGGTAHLVQPPTHSREDVMAAIDRFQLQPGTAIGSGMVVALATLFPDEGIEVAKLSGQAGFWGRSKALNSGKDHDPAPARPVTPGSYESAAIVLLTDGQNTTGPDPMDVAQVAANHGVKVFTVGFGTPEGATIGFEGWSMRVRLDEDTLKKIANLTQGAYFPAATGADLNRVYEALHSRLVFEKKETEVTVLFAMAAALLMLAGVGLSVWWFGRVA